MKHSKLVSDSCDYSYVLRHKTLRNTGDTYTCHNPLAEGKVERDGTSVFVFTVS